jgi:hypothetical protein
MIISNALHLSLTPTSQDRNKPLIGYQSIVTSTNVTASTQAAGFPASSVANPLTAERWKPTALPATLTIDAGAAVDVDYFGMASHTFATNGCVITISYSTDGITYTDISDASPGDGKPLLFVFNEITARYWRVTITGDAVPSLGVLYIGQLLECQRGIYGGHTPVTMGRKTRVIRNKTEGGQFAGISIITEGVQTSIELKHLTADWYRENFEPFVIAARGKPFFFAWRANDYPYEVGYVWTTGDIRPSNMGIRNLMQVSFDVEGYSDD